jgi:polysaccharide pyruvyl transferase WcaK-like protein
MSRRYWRAESLWNLRVSCRIGGIGNPAARKLLGSSAVLDLSGGDSFTDLYGPRRFKAVTLVKQIALENRIPLVLLPQTYGPFNEPKNRRVAESIVRRARVAWARDQRSFDALRELLGAFFDPERHRCGVDVAFGLESLQPPPPVRDAFLAFLDKRSGPVAGFNVSGLIYNDPDTAAAQYGLKADYRQVVVGFLQRLLKESDCRIVLIPHVVTPPGHYESDIQACQSVAELLAPAGADRITVLPALSDPREVKWVIGKTDWFCGTRMHSTIAALSSGVPTAAIAYSLKTQGVFETCGQGEHVADPRALNTPEMIEKMLRSWGRRNFARESLIQKLQSVLAGCNEQMTLTLANTRESSRE